MSTSKKSIWATITGGLSSATPILLSCCKSGACVGVCASPIASLFGISTATLAGSPWMSVIEPLLIAISAVSFTVSYYSLYVIPQFASCGPNNCACEPSVAEQKRDRLNKFVFWFGLSVSFVVLSYFEYSKFNAAQHVPAACNTSCASPNDTTNMAQACCSVEEDTTAACCAGADSSSCGQL